MLICFDKSRPRDRLRWDRWFSVASTDRLVDTYALRARWVAFTGKESFPTRPTLEPRQVGMDCVRLGVGRRAERPARMRMHSVYLNGHEITEVTHEKHGAGEEGQAAHENLRAKGPRRPRRVSRTQVARDGQSRCMPRVSSSCHRQAFDLTIFTLRFSAFANSVWKKSLTLLAVPMVRSTFVSCVGFVVESPFSSFFFVFFFFLFFFFDRCSSNGGSPPAGAVASDAHQRLVHDVVLTPARPRCFVCRSIHGFTSLSSWDTMPLGFVVGIPWNGSDRKGTRRPMSEESQGGTMALEDGSDETTRISRRTWDSNAQEWTTKMPSGCLRRRRSTRPNPSLLSW